MESLEDRTESFGNPPGPGPPASLCQGVKKVTCKEVSSSVKHMTFVDQQDVGFLKKLKSQQSGSFVDTSGGCLKEEIMEVIIGGCDHESSFQSGPDAEHKDDDFLYCEECRTFFFNKCEVHGLPLFIPDTLVPTGFVDRPRRTLPPGLHVQNSSIQNAGLGVFNMGEIIPVGAHFGPYQGQLVDKEEAMNSGYSWVICKSDHHEEYIDATKETHANWMRYVNCARNEDEQNLVAFQYRGGILYRCCQPITPGQELLLWYEEEYARDAGTMFEYLWSKKCCSAEGNKDTLLEVFSCSLCSLTYTSKMFLQDHVRRCHEESIEPHRSEKNNKISLIHQQSSGFILHDSHGQVKPFWCPDCGKKFTRQSTLQRHQLIHTGVKPFRCSLCEKNFSRQSTLNDHQRIHTGEKPYQCLQCGKSFAHQITLQQHQHIHTGEKPYQCAHCGKGFTDHSNLRHHQRIHTGVKPYHCLQCRKSFTRQSTLQRHQRLHTEQTSYHNTDLTDQTDL